MKQTFTFGSLAMAALLTISSPSQAAEVVKSPAAAAGVDASRLGADLLEVAKLVQSGVDEGVILTFIDKNPLQRNPTADELVYLKNVGLSGKAMVALMSSTTAPPATVAVQPVPAAPAVQNAPLAPVQPAPVQPTVVTPPPVVYAPVTPPTVYVERPYVDYSYPAWSFGLHLGHQIFGHGHWGHHGGHWSHHGGHRHHGRH